MADKGVKSKRRLIQYGHFMLAAIGLLSAVAVKVAPAAAAAMPQYAAPIGLAAFAIGATTGELARRSKNKQEADNATNLESAQPACPTGND